MSYASGGASSRSRLPQVEDYDSDNDGDMSRFMYSPDSYYQPNQMSSVSQGIVVSGEASESDDDDTGPGTVSGSQTPGSEFSVGDSQGRQSSRESIDRLDSARFEERRKYSSLLHRKLRERNASLHKNLVEMACQPYQSASKEIHSISQQLIKSQLLVQEVSSTLRRLTNELFMLEDKVQTIRSCSFLPDVVLTDIPSPQETP